MTEHDDDQDTPASLDGEIRYFEACSKGEGSALSPNSCAEMANLLRAVRVMVVEDEEETRDLLRRALKNHDAIASALRTGIGNQRLLRAIDDMRAVKEQAAAMGCYKASIAVPRPTPEPQP